MLCRTDAFRVGARVRIRKERKGSIITLGRFLETRLDPGPDQVQTRSRPGPRLLVDRVWTQVQTHTQVGFRSRGKKTGKYYNARSIVWKPVRKRPGPVYSLCSHQMVLQSLLRLSDEATPTTNQVRDRSGQSHPNEEGTDKGTKCKPFIILSLSWSSTRESSGA